MIDLKNTWIKKEDSVLQEAWVAGCLAQGLVLFTEDSLSDRFNALCCDTVHIMSTTVKDELLDERKELTSEDLKLVATTLPKTKTTYERIVYGLAKEKAKIFSEEEIYFWTNTVPTEGVVKGDCCYAEVTQLYQLNTADPIYRKVETEVCWWDNIPVEGVLCWIRDSDECSYSIGAVLNVILEDDYPYKTGASEYEQAKPFTQDEIKVFLNNTPDSNVSEVKL